MGLFNWLRGKKDPHSKWPSAERVAARALALAAVVCRADLERDLEQGVHDLRQNEQARQRLLHWLDDSGLQSELEPEEARFLATPVTEASERTVMDGGWRQEGLAVLAWALGRFEPPPYDQEADQKAAAMSLGFPRPITRDELESSFMLRSAPEIDRFAGHMTIVSWRLRQFRLSRDSEIYLQATEIFPSGRTGIGEPMDFVAYLRAHPRFREIWFECLCLIDGDLAFGGRPIGHVPPDEVQSYGSIALERQIAAYWLQGDHKTYSKVNPVTLLSAC
jgi:hypothetical protein